MKHMLSGLLLLGLLLGTLPAGWCSPSDQGWQAVGIRDGVSATSRSEFFHKYELYATYGLPWSWRAASGWGLALQLDGSAGALHGGGETGAIGSLGPVVSLDKGRSGLAFKLGADLSGVSRYRYGNVDLNGYLLFIGHVGLLCRFAGGPGIGYRFQHMSNGSGLAIGGHGGGNTGVDFHMLDLSWNFP